MPINPNHPIYTPRTLAEKLTADDEERRRKEEEERLKQEQLAQDEQQNEQVGMSSGDVIEKDESKTDYSLYGDGFSQEDIDQMNSDKAFNNAMQKTAINEGGYNNSSIDRGGETNYGISSRWYPNENIKEMTKERAKAIMHRDFWYNSGIHKLPALYRDITFDTGVVQGAGTSIKHLQNAVGVKADGVIGPKTIEALERVSDPNEVMLKFESNVNARYDNIISKDPRQKDHEEGWKRRIRGYRRY